MLVGQVDQLVDADLFGFEFACVFLKEEGKKVISKRLKRSIVLNQQVRIHSIPQVPAY